MRIAHVIDSMEVGGAEVIVASLCRIHRKQGHEVEVHCLFRKGILGEELESEKFAVLVHGPAGRLATMRSLRRSLSLSRPEAGHCHNATAAIWGAPSMRLAGVRTVVATRHGLVAPPYGYSREIQFSLTSRLCYRTVGVCQATSRNMENAPLAGPQRIVTIYNGVAEPLPGDARPPRGEGLTFVSLGRLAPPKDHATLLRAFAEFRPAMPGSKLWIVGDGRSRPQLEALQRELKLEESVTFWGERRDPHNFLRGADVFVLSSLSEGLPMSLLEAMAVGLPVIVSDVGGMPEVAGGANAGFVVPTGDVQSLANAMRACAADPAGLRSAGERALAHYQRHFTLEAMASAYLRLYSREKLAG